MQLLHTIWLIIEHVFGLSLCIFGLNALGAVSIYYQIQRNNYSQEQIETLAKNLRENALLFHSVMFIYVEDKLGASDFPENITLRPPSKSSFVISRILQTIALLFVVTFMFGAFFTQSTWALTIIRTLFGSIMIGYSIMVYNLGKL